MHCIHLIRRIFAACCLLLLAAQISSGAEATRQLKTKVIPEYPELARRVNIRGAVRLELQVLPDGHVKEVKVLGGNPVLVQAAVEAVRKWRYSPAPAESIIVVKLDFDPSATRQGQ
jgi:TonB family protein